jgi:hypothetical protein
VFALAVKLNCKFLTVNLTVKRKGYIVLLIVGRMVHILLLLLVVRDISTVKTAERQRAVTVSTVVSRGVIVKFVRS